MYSTNMSKWQQEEIRLLIEEYSRKGPKSLAATLGRTTGGVYAKAKSLGLSRGISAGNRSRRNKWRFTGWSYDLGYIAGVYLGDGNIYQGGESNYFRLTSIDQDFCEATKHKIMMITGYQANIKYDTKRQQFRLVFCNKDFVDWLRKTFGGPRDKSIVVLPNKQANMGLIEGLFDSEGTVTKYSFCLRMQGNITPLLYIIFSELGVEPGPNNNSGQTLKYNNLSSLTISNKEYTRVGLRTYIKRKSKNGILHILDQELC